jgi:dihydroflavonol-4-reductase
MDKMRALVTGSNGFIGSHLVEYLLSKNYDVSCFVRRTSNLQWLKGLDVKFAYGDCSKKETLYDAVRNQDYVFHLAGKIKATDWDTYYRANYLGTKNIIETCAEVNPDLKRFIYVSSISAAGPSVRGRLKKEDEECRPINEYGKTKLLGEEAVKSYAGKISYVIIRPPNVLGPRQEDLYSILRIIKRRIKPLLGNGDKQLSICFVQDLVRGIEMAATRENTVGKIYYITDGKTYSWLNIADVIVKELGVAGFFISIPYPILIIMTVMMGLFAKLRGKKTFFSGKQVKQIRETYLTYDGSKAARDFGFRASIDLETGIRDTIAWYRQQRLL